MGESWQELLLREQALFTYSSIFIYLSLSLSRSAQCNPISHDVHGWYPGYGWHSSPTNVLLSAVHPPTHPSTCTYKQYGPAVDMWSVGCIVAELLTKSAIFPGKNESDQLSLILDMLGTPTSQTWPGWMDLPDAHHWRDSVRISPRPNRLRSRFSQ